VSGVGIGDTPPGSGSVGTSVAVAVPIFETAGPVGLLSVGGVSWVIPLQANSNKAPARRKNRPGCLDSKLIRYTSLLGNHIRDVHYVKRPKNGYIAQEVLDTSGFPPYTSAIILAFWDFL
jgi:hypothetical protein